MPTGLTTPRSPTGSRRARSSWSTSRRSRATRRRWPPTWPACCAAAASEVLDLGDACVLAGRRRRPATLLAGHLDTVPAQDNRPGRSDGERVHGLGASDMKGGLAVMVELALAGAPCAVLFFPREELPVRRTALTPLLEREPAGRRGRRGDGADRLNAMHAGCLGNVNATLDLPRAQRPLRAAVAGRQRDRARGRRRSSRSPRSRRSRSRSTGWSSSRSRA